MLISLNVDGTPAGEFSFYADEDNVASFHHFQGSVYEYLLNQKLLVSKDASFQLSYDDDEGDRLSLKTDEDIEDMLTSLPPSCSAQGQIVKVFVVTQHKSKQKNLTRGISLESKSPTVTDSFLYGTLNPDQITQNSLRNLAVLGSGHCGTVYKTLDLERDRLMAVKCIALDIQSDVQDKILAEMEVLRQCSSPYIVDFYAALFMENQFSLCMEFMDGGSLDKIVPISPTVLNPVACCMINGLTYLWQLKIMHRDVKPSNVLINSSGAVKLCDFGVSIQLEKSIAVTYVGTSAYMAPERLLGGEYKICSDIWSLGISLIELSLGRFPYDTGSPDAHQPMVLMQRIVSSEVPQFTDELINSGYCPQLCDMIQKCTAKPPEDRISPQALAEHPFMLENTLPDHKLVAEFVCEKLRA